MVSGTSVPRAGSVLLSTLHGRLYSQMSKNSVGPGSRMALRDWKEEVLGDSQVSGLGETSWMAVLLTKRKFTCQQHAGHRRSREAGGGVNSKLASLRL